MITSNNSSSRGSALVDFVLLVVPFVLVPFSVISVSLITYAQAVLQDSAIEGARFAALADQESSSGCLRSLTLARQGFAGFLDLDVSCGTLNLEGNVFEQVVVTANVPVFGVITASSFLSATGRAPRENY